MRVAVGHQWRKPERKFHMSKKIRIDFGAPLREIKEATAKLNRAAEDATKEIEKLEKELLEADIGVSVWTDAIFEASEQRVGEDGKSQNVKRVVKLGFAKVSKWGITVSEEVLDGKGKRLSLEQELLRKAERDLRLLGHEHLGVLLTALNSALSERVAKLPQPAVPESEAETSETVEAVDASPPLGIESGSDRSDVAWSRAM